MNGEGRTGVGAADGVLDVSVNASRLAGLGLSASGFSVSCSSLCRRFAGTFFGEVFETGGAKAAVKVGLGDLALAGLVKTVNVRFLAGDVGG